MAVKNRTITKCFRIRFEFYYELKLDIPLFTLFRRGFFRLNIPLAWFDTLILKNLLHIPDSFTIPSLFRTTENPSIDRLSLFEREKKHQLMYYMRCHWNLTIGTWGFSSHVLPCLPIHWMKILVAAYALLSYSAYQEHFSINAAIFILGSNLWGKHSCFRIRKQWIFSRYLKCTFQRHRGGTWCPQWF